MATDIYDLSWEGMTDDQLRELSKNAVLERLNELGLSKDQIKALQILLASNDTLKIVDLLFDLNNHPDKNFIQDELGDRSR
jgi:hypothetical protein